MFLTEFQRWVVRHVAEMPAVQAAGAEVFGYFARDPGSEMDVALGQTGICVYVQGLTSNFINPDVPWLVSRSVVAVRVRENIVVNRARDVYLTGDELAGRVAAWIHHRPVRLEDGTQASHGPCIVQRYQAGVEDAPVIAAWDIFVEATGCVHYAEDGPGVVTMGGAGVTMGGVVVTVGG